MNQLVAEVRKACDQFPLDADYEQRLFLEGGAGLRVVALAIARQRRNRNDMDVVIKAIANSLFRFEQYQALQLAKLLYDQATSTQRAALQDALLLQRDTDP